MSAVGVGSKNSIEGQFSSPAISAGRKFPFGQGSLLVQGPRASAHLTNRDDRLRPAQERSALGTGKRAMIAMAEPTAACAPKRFLFAAVSIPDRLVTGIPVAGENFLAALQRDRSGCRNV
jgi:hypothetical protein